MPPPRVGKKQKKRDQSAALGTRLPTITPNAKCKLRLLKLERVKDYLLMEEEWVKTQELLKPHEERNEEDRTKVRPGRMHADTVPAHSHACSERACVFISWMHRAGADPPACTDAAMASHTDIMRGAKHALPSTSGG